MKAEKGEIAGGRKVGRRSVPGFRYIPLRADFIIHSGKRGAASVRAGAFVGGKGGFHG